MQLVFDLVLTFCWKNSFPSSDLVQWRCVSKKTRALIDDIFENNATAFFVEMVSQNDSGGKTPPMHKLESYKIGVPLEMSSFLSKPNRFKKDLKKKTFVPTIKNNFGPFHLLKESSCQVLRSPETQNLYNKLNEYKAKGQIVCVNSWCAGWDSACQFQGIVEISIIDAVKTLNQIGL